MLFEEKNLLNQGLLWFVQLLVVLAGDDVSKTICILHWASEMQQYKNNKFITVIFPWLILVTVTGATFCLTVFTGYVFVIKQYK